MALLLKENDFSVPTNMRDMRSREKISGKYFSEIFTE